MRKIASVILISLLCASVAYADVLRLPVGQQAGDKQSIERPNSGVSKQQVVERFGEPRKSEGPVGEPPITTWYYDEFIVYFEYDHVIHSVLKRDDES